MLRSIILSLCILSGVFVSGASAQETYRFGSLDSNIVFRITAPLNNGDSISFTNLNLFRGPKPSSTYLYAHYNFKLGDITVSPGIGISADGYEQGYSPILSARVFGKLGPVFLLGQADGYLLPSGKLSGLLVAYASWKPFDGIPLHIGSENALTERMAYLGPEIGYTIGSVSLVYQHVFGVWNFPQNNPRLIMRIVM